MRRVTRDVISDELWTVIEPTFPAARAVGRPPVDRRLVVEANGVAVPHGIAVA